MAYQMQYRDVDPGYEKSQKRKHSKRGILIFCAIAIIIILLMIPAVQDFIIPGNAEVTKSAAGQMIEKIQSGEGVVEAFAQFCREVIYNS